MQIQGAQIPATPRKHGSDRDLLPSPACGRGAGGEGLRAAQDSAAPSPDTNAPTSPAEGKGKPATAGPPIAKISASAYTIPTDFPESDGTIEWNATTLVLARVEAGGHCGLGYTYGHRAAVELIADPLSDAIRGLDAFDIPLAWQRMNARLRNIGRPGLGLMAIAAVDHALWDLKAKLLDLALVELLGRAREKVAVYGSGGFTSYSIAQLQEQLGGWAAAGIASVKMKVGREPQADVERVRAARVAVGSECALMVDANGAYARQQALRLAQAFADHRVCWFEEPVSSDDLEGLRALRERAPAGMEIAAGEYGWDANYFRRMLEAQAVDVLQIDSTRCGGFSGFMQAAALCASRSLPLSAHCAPALHAHICACVPNVRHLEYFHDHARIERLLFDGALEPQAGALRPDVSRPGLGLELREADARAFQVA